MAFDDKDGPVFPTRTGGSVGTSEENRMLQAMGGADTIKTKIVMNVDGAGVMCRTRNGHPEFTAIVYDPPKIDRTFVFRHLGYSLGVIANRFNSGMKVLVRDFAISASSYVVGLLKTSAQGKWNDVLRIEGTAAQVNGTAISQALVNGGIDRLPYVVGGGSPAPCATDTSRSTLFAGYGIQTSLNVKQASVAGGTSQTMSPTNAGDFDLAYNNSAGVRVAADGSFHFYGSKYTVQFTYYMNERKTCWSAIKADNVTPFLEETDYDTTMYSQTGFPHTSQSPSGNPAATDPLTVTETFDHSPFSSDQIFYVGSDLDITVDIVAEGARETFWETRTPFAYRYAHFTVNGAFTGSYSAISSLVGLLLSTEWSVTDSIEGGWPWHVDQILGMVYDTPYLDPAHATSSFSMTADSVDFIYADIDEDIYLTLEVHAVGNKISSYAIEASWTDAWPFPHVTASTVSHSGTVNAKYVLKVRGTRYEFDVRSDSIDSASGAWGLHAENGRVSPMDIPIFAPAFMAQGNCPYVAYTTRLEENAGATPEIYLDLQLTPKLKHRACGVSGGDVAFVPHNAIAAIYYACWPGYNATAVTYPSTEMQAAEAAILLALGAEVPFKIQFANGVKGVWQSQLGEGFTGYPSLEISRR